MLTQRALAFARANRRRFVDELKQFVRIPSVSAQPAREPDVRRCASWLGDHLRTIGLHVRVLPLRGKPLVYARTAQLPGRPTLLVYGHYDVQPADPLRAWQNPPFDPVVRGGHLYGRGASDDKGQLFAHVKALEAWLRGAGRVPANVKCLFEGEEEVGSPNLAAFLRRHRRALSADAVVISDMPILGPDRPAVTHSLRGGLAVELEVTGPARDLHSGTFGNAVHNPLQALCEIIAGLHDTTGRVAIRGFYEGVMEPDARERAYMGRVGPSDARVLRDAGVDAAWGERGFSLYERTTVRPALTVNGIRGGYQGQGPKSIIPASATAKLSFRLVRGQDPRRVVRLLRRHLGRVVPPTVRWSLTVQHGSAAASISRCDPALQAAAEAYRLGFGAPSVFRRSGGSIPSVNMFRETLRAPVILMGFGLPDDGAHGPNEKFRLQNYFRGIDTAIHLLARLAGSGRGTRARVATATRCVTRTARRPGRTSPAWPAPRPPSRSRS